MIKRGDKKSHSVWSAWIEINKNIKALGREAVALRLECVDRNYLQVMWKLCASVALRLECVDRNQIQYRTLGNWQVALRLECVDRNSIL